MVTGTTTLSAAIWRRISAYRLVVCLKKKVSNRFALQLLELLAAQQPEAMKLADSYIDPQEGALLAWDAIHEWLDRYRLEADSETEQVVYEGIMDALKRADLIELK